LRPNLANVIFLLTRGASNRSVTDIVDAYELLGDMVASTAATRSRVRKRDILFSCEDYDTTNIPRFCFEAHE
jgi:hypothetical protein